jgi:hypothetical protein
VPAEGKDCIGPAIEDEDARVAKQYGLHICKVRSDNESALGNSFKAWCKKTGITWLPSSTYTPAQNGGAERAGGVVIRKATTMRILARLPENLWPDLMEAATYLHNMTPTDINDWKSPLETLNEALGRVFPIPSYAHLKAFGCRAYPLTREVKAKLERKRKLKPRAHIGYLVGYDATNIYRIWVPALKEVIRTRDVTFNESLFFDPRLEDLTALLVAELKPLVKQVALPD